MFTNPTLSKRLALYGFGCTIAGLLAYGGWRTRDRRLEEVSPADIAVLQLSLGLYSPALESAERALARDPRDLNSLLVKAHASLQIGDRSVGEDCYKKALSLAANADQRGEIRVALAASRLRAGDLEQAREQVVLAQSASNAETVQKCCFVSAQIEEACGRMDEAAQKYLSAGRGAGPDKQLSISAALRAAQLGQVEGALEILSALGKEDPHACYQAAKLKIQLGNADSGLEDLRVLRPMLKQQLAAAVRSDAEVWQAWVAQGVIPDDLREFVVTLHSGGAPSMLEGKKSGGNEIPPASKGEPVR
ncbi:MAG: hypothetical protein JNJ88_20665 [Planctomycetes bacterium]|nr:hypothetical protein [Planctomycetota bacterium]